MKLKVLIVFMISIFIMLTSCFLDDDNDSDNDNGVSSADSLQSELKVIEANAKLFVLFNNVQGAEDDSAAIALVRNFDFVVVNALYTCVTPLLVAILK